MHLPKKTMKGFTLIELLISISIIAIITGASVPSFLSYIKSQTLKQAQEQVVSELRTVQNKALTGTASDQMISSKPVTHWGVRLTNGSSSYTYFYSNEATANACGMGAAYSSAAQGTGALPEGVSTTFTGTSPGCLFFAISNGDVTGVGITATGWVYTISLASTAGQVGVKLNAYGLITVD